MTVEEQMLMNTLSKECERLHKELQKREGEWEQGIDGTFLCSECGEGYTEQPTIMGNPLFEYCPCCGARMKGKKNDDTKNRCG